MRQALGLLLLSLALGGGCRSPGGAEAEVAASPEPSSTFVDLRIESHNWADVIIYIEHGGQRSRLGLAKAASVTMMRIPAGWTGFSQSVRLVAHRVGSPTEFRSEAFVVLSDQDVVWTLETDLEHSSLTLR